MQTLQTHKTCRAQFLMGCIVQIEVSGFEEVQALAAADAAFEEMNRIENLLSKFLPDSEVSLINQEAAKAPVALPSEVFELIRAAKEYSKKTLGLFDITKTQAGSEKIILNRDRETLAFENEGLQIDLGAIGKGYGVDQAVRILLGYGVRNAVVNTGSTIYALGGEETLFGVRDPEHPEESITSVLLQDQAVSTSGNYEQGGHLIHPGTGQPHQGDFLSVSVTSPSAMTSDVLSSALFLADPKTARAILEDFPDSDALFVKPRFLGKSLEVYRGSGTIRDSF